MFCDQLFNEYLQRDSGPFSRSSVSAKDQLCHAPWNLLTHKYFVFKCSEERSWRIHERPSVLRLVTAEYLKSSTE